MNTEKTLYALGQICDIVFPGPGEIPQTILDVILTRPASGLALVCKHQKNTAEKQDAITEIVNQIEDIHDPEGGISIEDQGPFWLGYYHHGNAVRCANKYGPDELAACGQALYGDRWQTDLARDLGLSDARRIRQWLKSERPIPVGVWQDIAAFIRHRQLGMSKILRDMTAG